MISLKKLNYLHHNDLYDYFKYIRKDPSSRIYLVLEILRFLKKFFFSFFNFRGLFNLYKIKGKNLFYVGTLNQYNSKFALKNKLSNSIFISIRFKNKFISSKNTIVLLNDFLSFLFSILLTPLFLKNYLECNSFEKNKVKFFFYEHYTSFGYYFYWNLLFKLFKPKSIFVSNELKSEYRSIVFAAKKNNIITNYLSHGVTFDFKKTLEPICDNYFLSGEYERNHYKNSKNSLFHIVGRPVYDNIIKKERPKVISSIGICTNSVTNIDAIKTIIKLLNVNYKIYYRPHPGHNVLKEKIFCKKNKVKYSNSNKININDFFQRVDLVITGASSVVIETLISRTYCVIFDLDNSNQDPQNFIKNKICSYYYNINKLVEDIRKMKLIKGNIDYYVDKKSLRNSNSTQIISNIILKK